jgi:DNA-binding NarL/FixJ family response regulator
MDFPPTRVAAGPDTVRPARLSGDNEPTSSAQADADRVERVNRIRVVVADDEVLLRHALATLLERLGFEVVGLAGTAEELIAVARAQRPDLAIVDIRMPPAHRTEGLDAARLIRQELPQTAIVVLSGHVEVADAMDLLAGGQRIGYILKQRVVDVPQFQATLERVVTGDVFVDSTLVQELLRTRAQDPLDGLSPRELEVLGLMAEGRSNAGISKRLWVAERTVEKHVRSILTKLGLTDHSDDHRRVLAVLRFLDIRTRSTPLGV